MLVIHLNSGKKVYTHSSYEFVSKQIEDANLGWIRLLRVVEPFETITSIENVQYPSDLVECIIDKEAIDLIDFVKLPDNE